MDMEIIFPGGKRVDARFKGFTVRTDQDKEDGGEGSEPAPFELFLASMGTCAGIYVLNFCEKRGLPTEGLKLVQSADWDDGAHAVTKVSLEIRLPAGFPEKYETAAVRAASLCTVKRHLEKPPVFEVRAVRAS